MQINTFTTRFIVSDTPFAVTLINDLQRSGYLGISRIYVLRPWFSSRMFVHATERLCDFQDPRGASSSKSSTNTHRRCCALAAKKPDFPESGSLSVFLSIFLSVFVFVFWSVLLSFFLSVLSVSLSLQKCSFFCVFFIANVRTGQGAEKASFREVHSFCPLGTPLCPCPWVGREMLLCAVHLHLFGRPPRRRMPASSSLWCTLTMTLLTNSLKFADLLAKHQV